MTAHEIIIRPIVSERSFSGMEQNKYTFEVAKDANKYQICLLYTSPSPRDRG